MDLLEKWRAEVETLAVNALLQNLNLEGSSEESLPEDDPSRYEGERKKEKRHGIGIYYYKGGHMYEGQWKKDHRSGYGTFYLATGEKYQGQWADDLQEGMGSHSWKSGELFEGSYSSGARVKGRYTHGDPHRRTFIGNWENDCPRDGGILELEDGQFEGSIYIQKLISPPAVATRYMITRHVKGSMVYKNGDRYRGAWHHDVREGFGVLRTADGTVYYGNWRGDKMSGYGILQYPDGTYYEGNFTTGNKHGEGRLCFPNGSKLVGEFSNGNVGKCSFIKGEFSEVSKPARTIIAARSKNAGGSDRQAYTSINKWKDYIEQIIVPKFPPEVTSPEEILEGVKNPESAVGSTITYFSNVFDWHYSGEQHSAKRESIAVTLAFAVDDITSFIDGLLEVLNACCKYQLNFDLRKKIHKIITTNVFLKVYDLIFPLYASRYEKKDTILKSKYKQLLHIHPSDIGIDVKYQLSRSMPTSPEGRSHRKSKESSAVVLMHRWSLKDSKSKNKANPTVTDTESTVDTSIAAGLEIEALYSDKNEPYYPVVQEIKTFVQAKTPRDKMKSLLHISNGIIGCVNQYSKAQNIPPQAMGAEDKFPVLIYAVIKAKIPLYAHCQFLSDFVHPSLSDPESVYRVEELHSVLKYIFSLDFKVRDEAGVLVPLHLVERSAKWELKKGIDQIPPAHRAKSLQLFLKILLQIGGRPESGHTFAPVVMKNHFDNIQCHLVSRYQSFFDALLQTIGLRLEVDGQATESSRGHPSSTEPKPQPQDEEILNSEEKPEAAEPTAPATPTGNTELKSESAPPTETKPDELETNPPKPTAAGLVAENPEEFGEMAPDSTIKFSIKYPLSVYTIIYSSLMEFYADQKFVTTGKWERPIYV